MSMPPPLTISLEAIYKGIKPCFDMSHERCKIISLIGFRDATGHFSTVAG